MSSVDAKYIKYIVFLVAIIFSYFIGFEKTFKNLNVNTVKNAQVDIEEPVESISLEKNEELYLITYVVDGDTVHVESVDGKKEIVRFLAVDTLEKNSKIAREKCLAKMQTDFTKTNLLNKNVYLVEDKTQSKRDKYDRLLAYIATTSTTTYYFNEFLLDTGNAKVYKATPPAEKYSTYVQKQQIAQNDRLGMWNLDLCK